MGGHVQICAARWLVGHKIMNAFKIGYRLNLIALDVKSTKSN